MITKVRAKMTVQVVEKSTYSEVTKFQCVMGRKNADGSYRATTKEEDKEDNSFASSTPGGSMQLQVDNKEVHGFFKPGKTYYVDITEVPEPAAN
jgi:hypothetical protein